MRINASLTRTFTFDIQSSVHICFLNQIFSLCYLFSRHAFYIIFDLYRDERCKLHTRYQRSASRKKQNRSICDDVVFSAIQLVTISSSARNLLINSQWRWFTVSCTTNLSLWILRDLLTFDQTLCFETNCSSRYASKQNKIVKVWSSLRERSRNHKTNFRELNEEFT